MYVHMEYTCVWVVMYVATHLCRYVCTYVYMEA